AVGAAGWPADLDRIDAPGVAEAEVQAGVAGRLVAAASEAGGDPAAAAGLDDDRGTDAVAVRRGPLEPQDEEAAGPLGAIAEQHERLVLGLEDGIGQAVVVQV